MPIGSRKRLSGSLSTTGNWTTASLAAHPIARGTTRRQFNHGQSGIRASKRPSKAISMTQNAISAS